MKKTTLSLLTIFALAFNAKAQNIQDFFLANTEDASKLTSAYMAPAMKGLVYSMNNGWYHTAKVHKKFGFDISIGANASFVPAKDEIFNISSLGLKGLTFPNGAAIPEGATSPTIAGGDDAIPARLGISVIADGTTINTPIEISLPKGADLPVNAVPAPSVQVGLGLPYKFDVMLRLVPKVGTDDAKGSVWGLGLKKEFTDLLSPLGKTPLHLSFLAAYTNMSVDYNFTENSTQITTDNANAQFRLNAYTVQAIASINFPIINFYGGLGYNGGNTKVNMLGDFNLNYGGGVVDTITDPVSVKNNTGSFNATIGTRLSLGFFKIFGSYTMQEYNSVNAGIAFSFR
ncbi:DUF6588 family protein [Tenacibaculum ovolyticum]|uniref:DUF6588 family protein n=1 Tax=Tenacibaculum ovolyticum TaxID=104270 RepID=UPI000429629C|nr:DUF6588 family protein [Tenacibaculum ovolyticum]